MVSPDTDSRAEYLTPSRDERPLPRVPLPTANVEGLSGTSDATPSRSSSMRLYEGGDSALQQDYTLTTGGRQAYEDHIAQNRSRSRSSTQVSNLSHASLSREAPSLPTNAPHSHLYIGSEHDVASSATSRNANPGFATLAMRPSGRTRNGDSSSDEEQIPNFSRPSPTPNRQRQRGIGEAPPTRAQFTVPRWQPDAEVTLCPICRTQFSFFIRKHHCRKCGRVVCNACSPHRITIPKEYIVHPPYESVSSASSSNTTSRPTYDRARAGSSAVIESLEGGERVRLCNPCVPDPNIAPPQVPSPQNPRQASQQGHVRSASTIHTSRYTPPLNQPSNSDYLASIMRSNPRQARQPSIIGNQHRHSESGEPTRGNSYNSRDDRTSRPEGLESRSRSSTMGSMRDTPSATSNHASLGYTSRYRDQISGSRRLPILPQGDGAGRSMLTSSVQARPQIPEEDECWICHNELPSRLLDNWEALREQHVEACVATAMGGTSHSPERSATTFPPATLHVDHGEGSSSTAQPSTAIPPVANTPEARMAAREQAHAAIVLGGNPQSPGSSQRRTGVFPYPASEKDCVDDAECTICLEEFEPGVQMGRLECFCRFHLKCIREWFVTRPGQCPVHQHGGGY